MDYLYISNCGGPEILTELVSRASPTEQVLHRALRKVNADGSTSSHAQI